MDKNEIKAKTVSNLVWRFAERCSAQGVSFIVSLILARLLAPADYGTIALVTVFINIFQVFVDSGLGNALIQKKDADDVDFSSVFYFNLLFCCVLYTGIFFAAPYIARFYANKSLIPVIRVLGLTLIISGLKNVQQAYISKKMMFRKFFFATLGGTIGAAILGIGMAYCGFGVWALIAQQIFNASIDTLILWITVKWRPRKVFSWAKLRQLFVYGWKLLVSSLINTVYNEVRQLIIGKIYSADDLAYYNRGKQFPHLFVSNINASIDSVLFPVMSDSQNDKERVKTMTRRAIRTSSYLMWPFMFGLMAIGKNLIKVLLTEKWMASVPFLYVFCFVYGMEPIHTANLNAIKAMGRSDYSLKLEIMKKSVGLIIILISMNYGVLAIALGSVVYTLYASAVNAYPNRKLLQYTYLEQIQDIMPALMLAGGMGLIVHGICILDINDILIILIGIPSGVLIYVGGSILFQFEDFYFLLDILKTAIGKIRKV